MRRINILFWTFLLYLNSFSVFPASAGDNKPLELSKADSIYISYVHEILNLSKEFGDRIWPGLDYNDIPILIYRPDTVAFLFNHPDPPSEFEPVEGFPRRFENAVYVLRGKFRNYVGQFWIFEDVNGAATFVCPYGDKKDWEERFYLFVIHEAFHTFQPFHFADMGDSQEEYYPLAILDNNALATLENLILAKAANGLINADSEKIATRARQFAIVRAYRFLKVPQFVRKHERIKERSENTAYYVEKRFQEAGKSPEYNPTDFLNFAEFDPYMERNKILGNLISGINEHVKNGAIVPMAMPRYRIYDNGATVGYLLDFLKIDWKEQAMSDSSFMFHGLLMEKFDISGVELDLENLLKPIKEEFGYDEILPAAERNIKEYEVELEALEEKIRGAGKNEFVISMNAKRSFSRSKRGTKRVLYADEGHTTLIERIDQFLMKTDKASLTIKNSGLIFYLPEDEKIRTARLFTEQRPETMLIDGEEVPFSDGTYPFQSSFQLEIDNLLMISGESGKVIVNPYKFEIILE